ncbi:pPIWI_RE_Y domain-containing protein [Nocardiopsis chromatogenes]|uniref:pPIWI_RE_Y domain-containing protein n=1 Tax=Nocardiopsis chromatogenes TaxID=280239 RepID=UPI0003481F86|nr:hypothetical protein [Nocardiopsis chromatogenes]
MNEPSTDAPKSTALQDLLTGGPYDDQTAEEVLRMVALTVVELADLPGNIPLAPPYPRTAQMVIDRICLLGAYRYPEAGPGEGGGGRYPRGLTDLLAWCRDRPLCDWTFLELPERFDEVTERLIETGPLRPSPLCLRLSYGVDTNTPRREVERRVMRAVLDAYKETGRDEGFTEFRNRIIECPVQSGRDYALSALHPIGGVHPQDLPMDLVYTPVHDKYFSSAGEASTCRYCGLLLIPKGRGWTCEITYCRSRTQAAVDRVLHRDDGMPLHVVRPIRELIVAPARIHASERESPHVPAPDREL